MDEVQSWWEVPAVAHFCYVFRSAFKLFFFEIAELESALLDIQDPCMSISLERIILCLLQGYYGENSISDENWEEMLHQIFDENCEDDENIFSDDQYFTLLTPRSKIEILYRLCEFRLDADRVLEGIKDINHEDMKAKCMGKDRKNSTYWYFCDERLYKENPNVKKKNLTKNKEEKITSNKSNKSTREKRECKEAKPDTGWSIACHNISDWETLMKTFTKSKNTDEKELATAIKNHLPILQQKVAEKDHNLRKRYIGLAPVRTSSRIPKVQEQKKIQEKRAMAQVKSQELEEELRRRRRRQKLEETLRRRREEIRNEEKERQRQKLEENLRRRRRQECRRNEEKERAEMRQKIIEERAEGAQKRGQRTNYYKNTSINDYSKYNHETDVTKQHQKTVNGSIQRNFKNDLKQIEEEEEDDKNEHNSDHETSSRRTIKRPKGTKDSNKKTFESTNNISGRCQHTYSKSGKQQDNGQLRVTSRLQRNSKSVPKYKFESGESEQESDEAPSKKAKNGIETRLQPNKSKEMDQSSSEESTGDDDSRSDETESNINCRRITTQKTFTVTKSSLADNDCSKFKNVRKLKVPKIALYRNNLLNSSGASNWTLDSKAQKLHILNSTFDNLSPKRLKLDEGKSTASSTIKSPLSKENHVYKAVQRTPTPFITFGRIIPKTKPAIVRLDFRKPPKPPVSS